MSRSIRKTKIFGIAGSRGHSSEKDSKRAWHRHHRSLEREATNKMEKEMLDPDEILFYIEEEVMDVWAMDKDGKRYWGGATKKDMRK